MKKQPKKITKEEIFDHVEIGDLMKDSYLTFAVPSFLRNIPSAIDGLKPSQRRILYTLKKMKAYDFDKSADAVGQSMKLIPHGDQTIYQTLVYLTQKDRVVHPLVTGQGNLGYISQSLREFAAARYTEVKMSEFLNDFYFTEDWEFTDQMMTYKGIPDILEPVFLPTLLPMLLIQGSNGITPGYSCRVLPHSLETVAESYIDYIQNREKPRKWNEMEKRIISNVKLEFPNRCNVIKNSAKGLHTGKGKITAQGSYRILEGSRGKKIIQVYELPYLVEAPVFVNQCNVVFKKSDMLYGISDESGKEGILINIILKKDVPIKKAIEMLIMLTPFTTKYNHTMCLNKNGAPEMMNILSLFEFHYQNKIRILQRYFEDQKEKMSFKRMYLEGAVYILGNEKRRKEFIKMLEASNRNTILKAIKLKWNLEPIVGDYLINKKFSSLLNGLKDLIKERDQVEKEYIKIERILSNLDNYLIKQIKEKVEKYK